MTFVDHTNADEVYAFLRKNGQMSVADPDDAMVQRVRRLGQKDGIAFEQSTTYPSGASRARRNRLVSMALHDGHRNLVFPDASEPDAASDDA